MGTPALSICIPCYKRVEQVRNTLKSIYEDNSEVPLDKYEVIISDNDPQHEMKSVIEDFRDKSNLHYYNTSCEGFMNSYYVLTYGKGRFLKLHNSQNMFRKGSLQVLIDDIGQSTSQGVVRFYTNGLLMNGTRKTFYTFEEFMQSLSYWSSWSGGFGIWKDKFLSILNIKLDPLFPHTSLFLQQYDAHQYVIDDRVLVDVQRVAKRGGHNKFEAFTIHYPSLIEKSYSQGHITEECKNRIFRALYKDFIPTLLFNKYIARIETFEAEGFKDNCETFFPKGAYWIAWLNVLFVPYKMLRRKIWMLMKA